MKGKTMPEFVAEEEFVPKTREYAKGPRGPRARSDAQKPYDRAFTAAIEGNGYLHVQVAPGEVEDARKRVNAAARYNDRAVTEGEPRPGREKGTVLLSWKIRVPVARPKKASE
jgi:hypothetical protein